MAANGEEIEARAAALVWYVADAATRRKLTEDIAQAIRDAYEEAARVAERPIRGNGHSPETRILSEYAVETGRMIRDLKGPQYLPPRRLK